MAESLKSKLISVNLKPVNSRYSQKREENDRLDAEKLRNGSHRLQLVLVGSVEQHQAVHRNELRTVVDEHHVREGHIRLEPTLAVDVLHLADAVAEKS